MHLVWSCHSHEKSQNCTFQWHWLAPSWDGREAWKSISLLEWYIIDEMNGNHSLQNFEQEAAWFFPLCHLLFCSHQLICATRFLMSALAVSMTHDGKAAFFSYAHKTVPTIGEWHKERWLASYLNKCDSHIKMGAPLMYALMIFLFVIYQCYLTHSCWFCRSVSITIWTLPSTTCAWIKCISPYPMLVGEHQKAIVE